MLGLCRDLGRLCTWLPYICILYIHQRHFRICQGFFSVSQSLSVSLRVFQGISERVRVQYLSQFSGPFIVFKGLSESLKAIQSLLDLFSVFSSLFGIFQNILRPFRVFWGLSERFRCVQFLEGLSSKRPTSPHSATFGSCPPPPPLGRVCLSPPSSLEISPRARDGARALLIVLSSARSSDQPGPKPELVPGLEWWDTGPLCGRLPCCCCCCC